MPIKALHGSVAPEGRVAAIAELRAQPGRRAELLAAIEPAFAAAVDEPGTEAYVVCACTEDDDAVWFFELYRDGPARAAHSASPAIATLKSALGGLIAAPPRIVAVTPIGLKLP